MRDLIAYYRYTTCYVVGWSLVLALLGPADVRDGAVIEPVGLATAVSW